MPAARRFRGADPQPLAFFARSERDSSVSQVVKARHNPCMKGRPPKTLSELFEPPSTFRWDRHRHLLRDDLRVTGDDVALILERDRAGYLNWQTAALLRLPIGAVGNVLRVHARTTSPNVPDGCTRVENSQSHTQEKRDYMTTLTKAQRALQQAKERREAAARELGSSAGKSRAEIQTLRLELEAAEIGLEAAMRQLALAGVRARIGLLATDRGRRLAGRLYGLR
jgi:hypothetical protein